MESSLQWLLSQLERTKGRPRIWLTLLLALSLSTKAFQKLAPSFYGSLNTQDIILLLTMGLLVTLILGLSLSCYSYSNEIGNLKTEIKNISDLTPINFMGFSWNKQGSPLCKNKNCRSQLTVKSVNQRHSLIHNFWPEFFPVLICQNCMKTYEIADNGKKIHPARAIVKFKQKYIK